ncbi:MAG TPA: tyrosine-type recombinase/integrase [Mycobacteriales bacterium]|nr:tyrosine-type recombinase/integrase [Mycobacteriales bacterium]
MSALEPRVEEYLAIRRALGYKLRGYDVVLRDFTEWLHGRGASVVTAELSLAWAQSRPTSSPLRQRQRLTIVRRFAEYLCAIDPRTEVPAKDLLPVRQQRTAPYIYSPAEIAALMAAARSLTPPLKAATYETLVGLLACTGLRYGEAAGLDRDDVKLADASLVVRHAKNDRCRLVPIHATTVAALSAYAAQRDRLCALPTAPSFFVGTRGGRLAHSSVQAVFATLRRMTGIEGRSRGRLPRLHDLRHAFVVRTMIGWHRDGLDVQARLPLLSAYVGHVDPKATYWYQQAVPELLALAARRLEGRATDE